MKKHTKPNPGSVNEWLTTFEVGERRYTETTADTYHVDMSRTNTPPTRRPSAMAGMGFSCTAFGSPTTEGRLLIERLK